jgi:transposase-like protein
LCVRGHLRYALRLRNLEEIMAERNVHVDHVTIWRWIQRYARELNRRCQRELRITNRSWRVDETYLASPASGHIYYIGRWIPLALAETRRSRSQALLPESVRFAKPSSSKGHQRRRDLNNIVEQDHRAMKRRVRASQGFRSLAATWRTIQGIETVNMIRKGQVRWLAKDDIAGQASFTAGLFGVAVAA